MSDIYQRHRDAVAMWQQACADVQTAERQRAYAREILDKLGHELLASCEDPNKRPKPIVKRRRNAKSNGVDIKSMMREQPIPGYIPEK